MTRLHLRHTLSILALALAGVLALAACSGGGAPETAAGQPDASAPTASSSEALSTDSPPSADNINAESEAASDQTGDAVTMQPTRFPPERYADLEVVTLLPQDAIPAIDNPRFLSAAEADSVYDPDELVMGVEFGGEARAYSVPFLSRHEIVNDTVGGVKIAVTW